jgi:hypothetical protein
MTRNDRTALKLALERCRAQGEGRSQQLDSMLEDRSWEEVATFAAYSCQCDSLRLRPWQDPPCCVDEDEELPAGDVGGKHEAQQLLRQMLALGISRWVPDPLVAIAEAEKQKVNS